MRLELIGRFRIVGGAAEVALSAPRHRALLSYLALQPDFSASRERLAALLWGDTPDRHARQSLRQALSSVRKQLEEAKTPILRIEREVVALDRERMSVDAVEFRDLAKTEQSGSLPDLSGIVSGVLLDGLDLDVEPFNEWLRSERVQFRGVVETVLRRSIKHEDAAHHGARALEAAERLVAFDPDQEGARRLRIGLLAKYVGRDAALKEGEAVRAKVEGELGAGLEPETEALINQIRATDPDRGAALRLPILAQTGDCAGRQVSTAGDDQTLLRAAPLPAVSPVSRRYPVVSAGALAAVVLLIGLPLATLLPQPEQMPGPTVPAASGSSWASPVIPTQAGAQTPALTNEAVSAILVLPFTTASGGASAEQVVADRLTDDLIVDLSRAPGLRVIGRQTSRTFAGRHVDSATVGAKLGVRYVLEGDAQVQDGRLRVNVSLVDVSTGLQVWAYRFERPEDQRFETRDEISRGLTRRIQVSVFHAEENRHPTDPRPDAATIDELLAKGRGAMIRMSQGELLEGARTTFEEVLRRDPSNVSALTGLGSYHVQSVVMSLNPDRERSLALAETLLAKAIELDPSASMPYLYRGMLEKTRGQPRAALRSFAKVLELNPSYAPAYAFVGHSLSRLGHNPEALGHVRYAIRLSPHDHNISTWRAYAGQIELEQGHDAEAQAWLEAAIEAAPRTPYVHVLLAAVYAVRGDPERAERSMAEARRLAPWFRLERFLDWIAGTSEGDFRPRQLIKGLRKAFEAPH